MVCYGVSSVLCMRLIGGCCVMSVNVSELIMVIKMMLLFSSISVLS